MKALPGEELVCHAHNLPKEHPEQPRGIISYYATTALANAGTVVDWLDRIDALIKQDVQTGLLPRINKPNLQLLGESQQLAPGKV